MTNSKFWVFTLNNPNEQLSFNPDSGVTYAAWQFERAPTTGALF